MPIRTASAQWQRLDPSVQARRPDVPIGSHPPGHVSFHSVGARGVLFDSATQELYLLNRSGGFIWCCLADGMSPEDVVHELVRRSNSTLATAEECVRAAISNWQAHGLLDGDQAVMAARNAAAKPKREQSDSKAIECRPADSRIRVCRVLDGDFALQFWDHGLEAEALPLLQAHLVDVSRTVTATLEIARGEGGAVSISHGHETMQVVHAPQAVAPAVFASLMRLALLYSPTYPALHAAIVRRDGGVVLFPGESGCGKSTLMAGLLAHGRRVLCDDTAVIERETMRVRPLTPYLCIKEGSWDVLADRLPSLMQQPDYIRTDAAHVRYLLAPVRPAAAHSGLETSEDVRAIVFPRYRAGAPARLTRVAGFLALKELLPSLDPIGYSFTALDIDRLIEWLAATECYTLSYGTLHEADAALADVLGGSP